MVSPTANLQNPKASTDQAVDAGASDDPLLPNVAQWGRTQ